MRHRHSKENKMAADTDYNPVPRDENDPEYGELFSDRKKGSVCPIRSYNSRRRMTMVGVLLTAVFVAGMVVVEWKKNHGELLSVLHKTL